MDRCDLLESQDGYISQAIVEDTHTYLRRRKRFALAEMEKTHDEYLFELAVIDSCDAYDIRS